MNLIDTTKPASNISFHEIRFTPTGTLCLDNIDEFEALPYLFDLQQMFAKDWREGWFHLAADKLSFDHQPSLRFWKEIAKEYVTRLCHLPEEEEFSPLEVPGSDRLSEWLLKAPQMSGGEYLSLSRLSELWEQLNLWVEKVLKNSNYFTTTWNPYLML